MLAVCFKGFQYVMLPVDLLVLVVVGGFQNVVVVGVIGLIHVGAFPYTVFKIDGRILGVFAKVFLDIGVMVVSGFEDMVADFLYVVWSLIFLFGFLAYVVVLVKVVVGRFLYVVIDNVAFLANVVEVSVDVLVFVDLGAFQ